MRSFEYLADGHHVDDAGNLISCTYVDFRDRAARSPITTLQKASSKRHAIPGCGTIRISKPSCFRDRGEGLVVHGDEGEDESGPAEGIGGTDAAPADTQEATDEACYSRNGWIYCASIEPETPAERSAWREAMPPGYDAVSPIRRPRAFARALGAMVAEQAGPRGRTVLLRNTVHGEGFSAAHRSQTVYHGPVVYSDDPYRRLERASSDLELRDGHPRATLHVEAVPAFATHNNPTVVPRRYDLAPLPSDLRETTRVYATVEALRRAVAGSDAGRRKDAAAAAWHAEPIVRFICSTFGDGIAGVRVGEDGFIVITAELSGDGLVEASVVVGPEGTCACRISARGTHLATTAPDVGSFEQILKKRLAEVGVHGRDAES